jgi:hypothetical protein
MNKQKLSNLLLFMAAVLMLTVFAFAVRLPAAPDSDRAARKAGGCCCSFSDKNIKNTVKE